MTNQYFQLARKEEIAGNTSAALLLYISSFCNSFNSDTTHYPCGTVAKIRSLQHLHCLSDSQLMDMVWSYGPLTNNECRQLLHFSVYGYVSGIKATLAGSAYEC